MKLGTPLHEREEVVSTNAALREMAAGGASEGTALLARTQSGGKGRRGRSWWSPSEDNLYLSVLLRPADVSPSALPSLAPAAGLAVAEALETVTGLPARLKWPNDILVGNKKIGGVLIESSLSGSAVKFVVVGIGVNVGSNEFPPELREIATSVRLETGLAQPVRPLAEAVLAGLGEVYETFLQDGFGPLVPRWNARHALAGKEIRVETPEGAIWGRAGDIDEQGALLLETPGEDVKISLGEVV